MNTKKYKRSRRKSKKHKRYKKRGGAVVTYTSVTGKENPTLTAQLISEYQTNLMNKVIN